MTSCTISHREHCCRKQSIHTYILYISALVFIGSLLLVRFDITNFLCRGADKKHIPLNSTITQTPPSRESAPRFLLHPSLGGRLEPGKHKDFQFLDLNAQSCCFISEPSYIPPVLSTCPLHTNSGCGKEKRMLIGPWCSAKAAPVRNYLEVYWPCAGGLSAVNAIGTQLRDPINSGLTRWRMAVSYGRRRGTREESRK